jgi:hypothetical protein
MLYEDLPIIISFHSLRLFWIIWEKENVAINYLYITSYGDSIISIVLFLLFVSFSFYTHLLPLLFGGYMCFFINMILHFHSSLCLPDCLCSWEHEKSKYMSSSKCAKDKRNRMFASFGRKRRVLMIMSVKTRQILTWE